MTGIPWGTGKIMVSAPNRTYLLVPEEDLSLAPELALYGTYEGAFADYLIRHMTKDSVFVDIGANFGLFSVIAGKSGAKVYAWEPNPFLVAFLRQNLDMNYIDGTIIEYAAWTDSQNNMNLSVPFHLLGGGSLITDWNGEDVPVQTKRFDEVHSSLKRIDLVKIDVEGAEAQVLEGTSRLVEQKIIGCFCIEYQHDRLTSEGARRLYNILREYQTLGAKFSIPEDGTEIDLGTIRKVQMYSNLIIHFPWSRIVHES